MVSLDGGSACKVDDVTALPSHIQDGGYPLLWQRYDNKKMAAICYYGNVMATTRWRLCVIILHLQQYSSRMNLFFYVFLTSPICATCHIYLILLCSCTLVGIWCTCNAKLLLYVILSSPLIYFL